MDLFIDNYDIKKNFSCYLIFNNDRDYVFVDNKTYQIYKNISIIKHEYSIGDIKNKINSSDISNISGRVITMKSFHKNHGISHEISIFSKYIHIVSDQKGKLLIPSQKNTNGIINEIINHIYKKNVVYLEETKIYLLNNYNVFMFFDMLNDKTIYKAGIHLLYYDLSIFSLRGKINYYIDKIYKPSQNYNNYEKIAIVKTFDHFNIDTTSIQQQKARSVIGLINNDQLKIIENKGYVNISPYEYKFFDILYLIRNAKSIILSGGTCCRLYSVYLKKNTNLYILYNCEDHGIVLNENDTNHEITTNFEYNGCPNLFPFISHCNYKIIFYKANGYKVTIRKEYTGDDQFDLIL